MDFFVFKTYMQYVSVEKEFSKRKRKSITTKTEEAGEKIQNKKPG